MGVVQAEEKILGERTSMQVKKIRRMKSVPLWKIPYEY
jgi:hypothetical protein